jgi:hypothetical protein
MQPARRSLRVMGTLRQIHCKLGARSLQGGRALLCWMRWGSDSNSTIYALFIYGIIPGKHHIVVIPISFSFRGGDKAYNAYRFILDQVLDQAHSQLPG